MSGAVGPLPTVVILVSSVVALFSSASCVPEVTSNTLSPECPLVLPDFAAEVQIGTIHQRAADFPLSVVARDASMVLVGLCGDQLLHPPTIATGDRVSRAAGGMMHFNPGSATLNYHIFGPTIDNEIAIRWKDRTVASAVFHDAVRPADCGVIPTSGLRLVACAAIVFARWTAPIVVSGRVLGVDGMVTETLDDTNDLGFYLFGIESSDEGLIIEFGFQVPDSGHAAVQIISVQTEDGMLVLTPPVTAEVTKAR